MTGRYRNASRQAGGGRGRGWRGGAAAAAAAAAAAVAVAVAAVAGAAGAADPEPAEAVGRQHQPGKRPEKREKERRRGNAGGSALLDLGGPPEVPVRGDVDVGNDRAERQGGRDRSLHQPPLESLGSPGTFRKFTTWIIQYERT